MGSLSTLRFLSLESNQLTDVSDELGTLAALEALHLHSNLLSGEIPASLTGLTGLGTFSFNDTQWCAPASGAVPAWLDQIPAVYGTGFICGQALGSLGGMRKRRPRAPLPAYKLACTGRAVPLPGSISQQRRRSRAARMSSPVWARV